MRFGIFQSAQWPEGTSQFDRLREAAEQSVLAEQIGLDSVFMTEHHFSRHGIVPDNLVMLSYIAAQTRRIRLGTAVSVLPLHDPVRLAPDALRWLTLWAVISLLVGRHFARAIARPEPRRIGAAVGAAITTIITIDAALAWGYAGVGWAVAILALWPLTKAMAAFIPQT